MEKTAYLGPEGSYSQLAAKKLCPDCALIPYASFRLAVNAVESGECRYAVLPIENSLNGTVTANLDLLQAADGLFAFKTASLAIDHRLATKTGADLKKITRITSHEQALAQCAEYLYKNFPEAKLCSAPSTAASLDAVKSECDAAIAGAHVVREGITLSKENIADYPGNKTDFLLIKKGKADYNVKSDRMFFSVTCRHSSGALLDILEPMRSGGLNMTKIQSRPIKGGAGEYRFFIEAEGDISSEKVRSVLEGVARQSLSFKLLGAYFSEN